MEKKNVDFQAIIEREQTKAREIEARKAQYRDETPQDEFDAMTARIESFKGNRVNEDAMARLERLTQLANYMFGCCDGVTEFGAEQPDLDRRNAHVWIEVARVAFLKGDGLIAWLLMNDSADAIYIAHKPDGIRFTFVVKDVCEE